MRRILALLTFVLLSARLASAQDVGGATTTNPSDAPTIRVGGTIFSDFIYQSAPSITDTDGNSVKLNQFNVSRTYINVVGQISHLVSFRITPDITREGGVTNNLNGSLVFRLKYGYAQLNLDDWMTKGSYAQFGIQKTPWVAFYEDIYRYRFQGTTFTERETSPTGTNINSSADAAASFRYMFPGNYGDVHVGLYNGEFYFKPEVNNMKSFQVRASVRPFAQAAPALRGLRAHVFYVGDSYVQDAERKRVVGSVTYEGDYLHGGFDYLATKDQQSITKIDQSGKGWSAWLTPRSPIGLEALLRWDHFAPLDSCTAPAAAPTACPSTVLATNGVSVAPNTQVRKRTIIGVAYWFPHKSDARVGSAILVDYDAYKFDNFDTRANPDQRKIEAHWLVNW